MTNPDKMEKNDFRKMSEVIYKTMLDSQGNDKGYFTKDEWTVRLLLLPNEHWTEDEAEQTLQELVEEGNVIEIEPVGSGRYRAAS